MARKPPQLSGSEPKDEPVDQTNLDEVPPIRTRVILKKKDFLDRAVERSGVRKADAKAVVEATLAVLAEALAKGEELVLPPLGKIKVAREKANPKGRILMLRLQLTPDDAGEFAGGTEPLAEAAE